MRSVKIFFAFTLAAMLLPYVFAADNNVKEIPAPATGSVVPAGKNPSSAKEKNKTGKKSVKSVKETVKQAEKKADKSEKSGQEQKLIKPDLLRIEHISPAKQIVTTDKKDILIYKPDDRQAIKATWDGWVKTQNQAFYGILDFGNYSSLSKNNNVSLEGGEKGKPYVLVFTPKEGTAYRLALTLSGKDFFPAEAELSVGSAVTSTKLIKVRKNITLDRELFGQKLPEKTEIINF